MNETIKGWCKDMKTDCPRFPQGNSGKNKSGDRISPISALCRNEATRTPDPYVPNVVRYQLRYIPIAIFVLTAQRYEKAVIPPKQFGYFLINALILFINGGSYKEILDQTENTVAKHDCKAS